LGVVHLAVWRIAMSDSLPSGLSSAPEPAARGAEGPAPLAPGVPAAAAFPAPTPPATAPKPAKRDLLFYAVICLLVADILFGLGLALFAQAVLQFPPMAVMGLGLAVLGVGIMAYFLLLGDGRGQPALKRPKKRE
jgi:hypothetical protein